MPQYLIDINLPYYFSLWNNDAYVHQRDLDSRASDADIWQYAKLHNLTTITKDRDYSDRIFTLGATASDHYLRIGNMKLRDFHVFISKNWNQVQEMSTTHKLVIVFLDRIEGID